MAFFYYLTKWKHQKPWKCLKIGNKCWTCSNSSMLEYSKCKHSKYLCMLWLQCISNPTTLAHWINIIKINSTSHKFVKRQFFYHKYMLPLVWIFRQIKPLIVNGISSQANLHSIIKWKRCWWFLRWYATFVHIPANF